MKARIRWRRQLLEGLLTRSAVPTLASLTVIGGGTSASAPPVHLECDLSLRQRGFRFAGLHRARFYRHVRVFVCIYPDQCGLFTRTVCRDSGTAASYADFVGLKSCWVICWASRFSPCCNRVIILGYTIFGMQVHYVGSLVVVFIVELLLAADGGQSGDFLQHLCAE